MRIYVFLSLLVSLVSNGFGQVHRERGGCVKCDGGVVNLVELELKNPSDALIYKFLCTFGTECHTHIEYSEYSNEMLFLVLEKHPKRFIDAMELGGLDEEYIFRELSEPLVYEHIPQLIKIVSKVKGNGEMKKMILEALHKAKT